MPRSKTRITVVLLVITLALFIVSVCLTTHIPRIETPPCEDCSYGSIEIQSVSLCELLANHRIYQGKLIRVRALFHHDYGHISFRDETCPGGKWIYLDFAEPSRFCIGAKKALMLHTGFGSWYDGAAYATVVGSIANFENPDDFKYVFNGFTIECLERVEAGSGVRERILYTFGKAKNRFGF